MSAFVSEYPGVVRAIVTDIGVVTDLTHAQVRAVRCKALWDTGAVYSVISNEFAQKFRRFPTDEQRSFQIRFSDSRRRLKKRWI